MDNQDNNSTLAAETMTVDLRKCLKCKATKPLVSEFGKTRNAGEYTDICKTCKKNALRKKNAHYYESKRVKRAYEHAKAQADGSWMSGGDSWSY